MLSHPDVKIHQFGTDMNAKGPSPLNGLFSNTMSRKEVVKIVKNFVRNRVEESEQFIKVTKSFLSQTKDTSSTFEVELKDNEFNKIAFKRKKITSLRKGYSDSAAGLPIISFTSTQIRNSQLNTYQTVKSAILEGSFKTAPFSIQVKKRHFRYPVYQQKQNFNIMLVLDVSNSVKWILKFMARIISMLTAQAKASKDKLGLIIFNDDRAQILHYPTTNVKHVIGTINTLAPCGSTPLADGLKLAMQTLEHSRFQVTGMSNAIVLLSDCFPEPITGEYKDPLDEPACQSILSVCDKIAENKIKLLILNPSLNNILNYDKKLGYKLGKLAAERANGSFLNLVANVCGSILSKDENFEIPDKMLKKLMDEVSEFRI